MPVDFLCELGAQADVELQSDRRLGGQGGPGVAARTAESERAACGQDAL